MPLVAPMNARTPNAASAAYWITMSAICIFSPICTPSVEITVITAMNTMPVTTTMSRFSAKSCRPTRYQRYLPLISATLASTITADTATAQPPIQPTIGPNAFVPHTNVVPQSGISRLSSWYARAANTMGMQAAMNATGACSPTSRITQPRVAASEYSGAVEARLMTVEPTIPSALVLRPLPTWMWPVSVILVGPVAGTVLAPLAAWPFALGFVVINQSPRPRRKNG